MFARVFLLITCLGLALPAISQTGHPAKGSWSGNLNPFSAEDPVRVRMLIDAYQWRSFRHHQSGPQRSGNEQC